MQTEQTDKDPLLYLARSVPGDLPKRAGYVYAWGLTCKTREIRETRLDGSNQYVTGSSYISLELPRSAGEEARENWQDYLTGAYLEAKNSSNLPIDPSEASSFARKLRGVLNGTKTIDNYGSPMEDSRARAIALFLEPRIEIAVRLTSRGRLEVALATVDQLLPSAVSV